MGEVSNKTLATLLIAAIVVSLVGTLISLNKVNNLMSITGMATSDKDSGEVNVTINASAGILVRTNIDFGTGQIPEDQINLSTESNNADTGGFWNCLTNPLCMGMEIENVGNVPVTLDVSFEENAVTFLGGTLVGGPALYVGSTNGTQAGASNGCQNGTYNGDWTGNITAATNYELCGGLLSGIGANFVTMEVNITLPGDASGAKQNIVNLTATEI